MAKAAIEAARTQRDAAARTLAEHNLAKVNAAREILARMHADGEALKALAADMDPGSGKDGIGHLTSILGSVDLTLQHERDMHRRTLNSLAQS